MKVLKDNYNVMKDLEEKEPESIITCCDDCGSELEVSPEDMYVGWLGTMHCICPCCGEETMVEQAKGITLTKDNLEFPTHFLRTNSSLRYVKEVKNEEIERQIRDAIEYLRKHKDNDLKYVSYGDLFVIVFRYKGDENYFVLVTKDFYETDIPFEAEDYE